MSIITLSCLVAGENLYDNTFAVEIDITKLVSFFRDAIKEKINDNIKAKDLKLWKVDISLEEENKKFELVNTKINVNIKEELEGVELKPLSKISKHFLFQLADEHIHIIIQHPVETKEVHCIATYKHKSEKFLWAVTREQITLSALKTRLRTCFTFPERTENEHIVINRKSGKERIHLVDNEDLAYIIWSQGFKVDLPIIVNTYDYNKLSTFVGGVKDTPDDIRNQVIDEFLRLYKASQHITSANEATCCEYISRIIYGMTSLYGGEIKVYPQYEISESHSKSPVDWAIKIGNIIITITEAKREDINQGIAQNCNSKKRSYDMACLHKNVIYGIVSTAMDWVIIKLVSSNSENNNSEGKVEVLLSSLSPSPLPINKAILTHDDLVKPIKNLFEQINTQSNNLLRELNTKLLAKICELRKKFADDEVEKTKLRQELKGRTDELEKTISLIEQLPMVAHEKLLVDKKMDTSLSKEPTPEILPANVPDSDIA
ncbi:44726_t:CDS:2 [Gigaspora margarita]|uniref:44726_t:CDS:1 n=1 Tax=Gigaspora margarita TaxID=4874 RepID=A0ABN7W8S8_GIGMA|nr:44726_t:CDS:2 [Gigaspora margarita]